MNPHTHKAHTHKAPPHMHAPHRRVEWRAEDTLDEIEARAVLSRPFLKAHRMPCCEPCKTVTPVACVTCVTLAMRTHSEMSTMARWMAIFIAASRTRVAEVGWFLTHAYRSSRSRVAT